MNRNVLKIIAVVTMIIDHVGLFLFNDNLICRFIGRFSFPLFAFFISEGMRYTRSRRRYALNLSIFAIITQIPFGLLFGWKYFNVLFTFLLAIGFIVLIESYKKAKDDTMNIVKNILVTVFLVCLLIFSVFGEIFNLFDYGLYGIILTVGFYFAKSKPIQLIVGFLIMLLNTIISVIKYASIVDAMFKLMPTLAIILLFFYNGKKGKLNLKYLFYVAYPLNFLIFYLIKLFWYKFEVNTEITHAIYLVWKIKKT